LYLNEVLVGQKKMTLAPWLFVNPYKHLLLAKTKNIK